jgi:hypothetical protein
LRVEGKEKTRSKCEIIGEGSIDHHELPIVLLEPNTTLEGKILIKDAVNGRDSCFIVCEKETPVLAMISKES